MYKKPAVDEFDFNETTNELTAWLRCPATGKTEERVISGEAFGHYLSTEGSAHAARNAADIPAFIAGAPSQEYVCATIENYLLAEAAGEMPANADAFTPIQSTIKRILATRTGGAAQLAGRRSKDGFLAMQEAGDARPDGWPFK